MNIVNVGYGSTNYYVLGQGATKLLVDVGWPGTLPKLTANLKRKGLRFSDIRYLFATHYHPDHAGLAQELKNQGVELIVLEPQVHAIPRLKTWMKPVNHYVEIVPEGNLVLKLSATRAFLARLGIEGEMVATPGHSEDSVTLVLDEGIAFTGDLTFPALAAPQARATIMHSWDKLRALNVRVVYPAHGPVQPLPGEIGEAG